jgi:Leucine-rich repeat (LRR) protein
MKIKSVIILFFCVVISVTAQKNKEFNTFKDAYLDPENVYSLRICSNITTPSSEFEKLYLLKNLRSLEICEYFIENTIFIKSICSLQNLEQLQLPLLVKNTSLPKELNNLKKLKELVINLRSFNSFPEEILELKSLETLHLREINFSEITADLSQLNQLKRLVIERGDLKSIPKSVFKLKNLEELIFLDGVDKIPIEISQLQNLKILKLAGNNENKVDVAYNLSNSIEYLQLSYFNLKDISFVSNLKNIKTLSINTILTTFPSNVLFSKSLESVNLSGNFTTLPENFGAMFSNLISLEISSPLTTLPKSIESMSKLNRLILNEHQLKNLNIDFEKIPNLKEIEIHFKEDGYPDMILTPKQKQFIDRHSVEYGGG